MFCPYCGKETIWDYDQFWCQRCGRVIAGPPGPFDAPQAESPDPIESTEHQATLPQGVSETGRWFQAWKTKYERYHPTNASKFRVIYAGGHRGLNFYQRTLKVQRDLHGDLYVDPDQGLIFHTTNTWSERSIRIPWSRLRMAYAAEVPRGCLSFFGAPTYNLRIQYEPMKQGSYFEQTDTTVEFIIGDAHECSNQITAFLEKYRENERQKENRYNQYITANQIDKIPPDRFENLVKDLFDSMGYTTKLTGRTGDGGVDLVALKGGQKSVVQCKRYKGRVSVNIIRDLRGTMEHEGATYGFLVTTGGFSAPAIEWAKGKNIELIDKYSLAEMMRKYIFPDVELFSEVGNARDGSRPVVAGRVHNTESLDDAKDDNTNGSPIGDDAEVDFLDTPACTNPKSSSDYRARGQAYDWRGNLDQAIADYTKALELDPKDADCYRDRGAAYERKGDFDQAVVDLTRSIELKPNFGHTYIVRAITFNDRGRAKGSAADCDRAISDCTKSIELDPNNASGYDIRAQANLTKGEFACAIADYDKAIQLAAEDVYDTYDLFYGRGYAYLCKREIEHAISDFSKAIELNPEHANAYHARGVAFQDKNDLDKAAADFTEAIQLDPGCARLYHLRGTVYQKKGLKDQAIADYETYLRLAPSGSDRKAVEQCICSLE